MLSINGIFICVSSIVDEFIKGLIHKMEGGFFFPSRLFNCLIVHSRRIERKKNKISTETTTNWFQSWNNFSIKKLDEELCGVFLCSFVWVYGIRNDAIGENEQTFKESWNCTIRREEKKKRKKIIHNNSSSTLLLLLFFFKFLFLYPF